VQFDARKAAEESARFQKKGPGSTTRLLRDGLMKAGFVEGVLLDIGAGVGALTFELLDHGISRAVAVDASSSYLAVAAAEAARRGQTKHVQFVHGDFTTVAPRLPRAAIVTLDRVVCCYPLAEPLLSRAMGHAERALALSSSEVLVPEDLPELLRRGPEGDVRLPMAKMTLDQVKQWYVAKVLEEAGGNKVRAAEILGIDRGTLYRLLRRLASEGDPEE